MELTMSIPLWYEKGVQFGCTKCGKCCTGSPGYVWLTEEDLTTLCHHFKMDRASFCKKYTRNVNGKLSLLEDSVTYDCILLKNNQCTAYKARPSQCSQFPFWKSIMRSAKTWEEAKGLCEGINNPEGRVFSKDEIDEIMKK